MREARHSVRIIGPWLHGEQARTPRDGCAGPRQATEPPPGPPLYALRILRRCRIAGHLLVPGNEIVIAGALKVAAFHVRTGVARPSDSHTALAVELFELAARLPPNPWEKP